SRSCRPPERRRRGAGWRAAGATAGPTRSRRPRPTRRRCAPRPAASASRSGLPGPTRPGTGLPGPTRPGTGLPGPTGPGTGLPGPTGPGQRQRAPGLTLRMTLRLGGRGPPPPEPEEPRQLAGLPGDEQRRGVEDRRVGAADDADQEGERELARRHATEQHQRAEREDDGQGGGERAPERLDQAVVDDPLERLAMQAAAVLAD